MEVNSNFWGPGKDIVSKLRVHEETEVSVMRDGAEEVINRETKEIQETHHNIFKHQANTFITHKSSLFKE